MGENKLSNIEDDGSDDEYLDNVTKLVDGINLNELSEGTTFQIKPEHDKVFDDRANSYFGSEEILKHIRLECLDDCEEEGGPCVPGDTPFEKFATKMKDVKSDGGVKKKVIQQGEKNGPTAPKGALVTVHYNCYNEFIDEPYDSTYLRTGPQKYRLDDGKLLPGIEVAIKSMCRNERSWFLIQPHMAFGKLGCPPRIQPDATMLLDIHLLDFIDSGGAANFDAMTPDEQKNADFSAVLSAAKGFRLQGNDLFKSRVYHQAAKRFRRAVQILENCTTVKDQNDEVEQNHLLLKLYVNLGVTYNHLNDPPKACIFTKKALALDPSNGKALFHRGKAYVTLNEFSEARHFLLAAQRLMPQCREVNLELKRLEERQKSYSLREQQICQRMFASVSKDKKDNIDDITPKKKSIRVDVTDAFQETVASDLKEFVEDTRKEPLTFPQGLTAAEIDFIKKAAENIGLTVTTSTMGRLSIFKE